MSVFEGVDVLRIAIAATVIVAIVVIALAIRTRSQVAGIEAKWPPLGEFVEADGVKLHVLRAGKGVPIVLLHGASSNVREWKASIFDQLAINHEVIAFDRPGHGWSERGPDNAHDPRVQADIIHAAVEKLGLEKPILVGHSWSGAVVLAYALRHPGNIGGILFLAGVSHPWPGATAQHHQLGNTPVLGPLLANTIVPTLFQQRADRILDCVFGPNKPPAGYRQKAGIDLAVRPGTFVANAQDVARLKPVVAEMAPKYVSIKAPLIVMTGDADCVLYEELHSPPLVEKVEGAELRTLPGVGHMPHQAAPDAVINAITDLVARRKPMESSAQPAEVTSQ